MGPVDIAVIVVCVLAVVGVITGGIINKIRNKKKGISCSCSSCGCCSCAHCHRTEEEKSENDKNDKN